MARFFKQFWKRSKHQKGPFGGEIKPHHEVMALNKRIVDHEKEEFEAFEKDFDQVLKNL